MRFSLTFCGVIAATLLCLQKPEISAQIISPALYGGPLSYGGGGNSDDDIGILLAILLLAGRNRGGCGGGGNSRGCCCNCCNNCNSRTVPVPFPIAFPTNCPIINRCDQNNANDDDYIPTTNKGKVNKEIINFVSENDDASENVAKVTNDPKSNSGSSSSSSTSSSSSASNSRGNGGNNKPQNKNNKEGNKNKGDEKKEY